MKKSLRNTIALSAIGLSMAPLAQVEAQDEQQEIVGTEEVQEAETFKEQDSNIEKHDDDKPEDEIQFFSRTVKQAKYKVLSTKDTKYVARITRPWSINSKPYGTDGAETIMTEARSLVGKTVEVIQEKTTDRSTYALITEGGNEIGWIDISGLRKHVVESTKNVNYIVEVLRPWSINSQPWGIEGYKTTDNGSNYIGEKLNVTQEKKTERSIYLLLQKEGKTIGWIDQTGVKKHTDILSVKKTSYAAKLVNPWSINSAPFGTSQAKTILANSSKYLNKVLEVTQEMKTARSTYAEITLNGSKLGWIDVTALEKHQVLSTKNVNYQAELALAWSINSKPWGIDGFITNYSSPTNYLNELVTVTQEQVTPRSTYALINLNGKRLGWIDKNALNLYPVLSTKTTNYKANITKPWSINSKPWGVKGFKTVVNNSSYVGKTVDIIQETSTPRSTYGLIKSNGKEIGWIDLSGVEKIEVISSKDVNYVANVLKPWSINTAPWGTEGSRVIVNDTSLLGQSVVVTKEQTTPRSTYALIKVDGKELGWIDITGLGKITVISTKDVYYSISLPSTVSIHTKPWGTDGSKSIEDSDKYGGGTFDIIEEKETQLGTYGLLAKSGRSIGWINLSEVQKSNEYLSMRKVNYAAIIALPWSINTEPWGTIGYKPINESPEKYLNNSVEILAEKTTTRATYALIAVNNNPLGWIDTGALKTYTTTSTKNVFYNAEIVRPWSINTKPWGVYGFKPIANYTSYLGETVRVVKETKMQKSTYALIEKNGKELGWIDKTGIREVRPVIFLDPGHGGTDSGALGYLNGKAYKESDLNLKVSFKIRNLLEKQGYTVIMSRESDKTVGLYDRPRLSNEGDASLFISVHFNALKGTNASGIETFYYKSSTSYPSKLNNLLHNDANRLIESANLAVNIHNSLITDSKAVNRGVKQGAYTVVREVDIPAVLLELGFMTNTAELRKMIQDDYQNMLANSVVKGINNYYNKQ